VVAITILAFVTETWMVFALLPLFALGGIGVPALQSLLSNEVGPDKQGQLQGVLASLLSLTSVFGPLIFSWVYFYAHTDWPGFIWLIGAGLYCFTAPLLLAVRRRSPALP
jgi:MFS transporter, DHA1 family, tetracycline resistance protein